KGEPEGLLEGSGPPRPGHARYPPIIMRASTACQPALPPAREMNLNTIESGAGAVKLSRVNDRKSPQMQRLPVAPAQLSGTSATRSPSTTNARLCSVAADSRARAIALSCVACGVSTCPLFCRRIHAPTPGVDPGNQVTRKSVGCTT